MSLRETIVDVLEGRSPAYTPLCVYDWLLGFVWKPWSPLPEWEPVIEHGLGILEHVRTVRQVQHGVKQSVEEKQVSGRTHRIERMETPVGTLQHVTADWWDVEYRIKSPSDYEVMQWIVEHTEVQPCYEDYQVLEEQSYAYCFPIVIGSQSPAMILCNDYAGPERFCTDLALEVPELYDLNEAMRKLHMEEARLIASGPGRYVKWIENVTIDLLGPERYAKLLMPVYREAVPILETGGKKLLVHYDGRLRPIADQIADAPFHIIEGLTEPPEGDMMLDECRRNWPDKVFWANVNLGLFSLSPDQLRQEISAKRNRAGKRALAFELGEDIPPNWKDAIPILLDVLRELD